MNTTTETTNRTAALAAILATRDAGEDDLREAGLLPARGDAEARRALEDAASACNAGRCVMCAQGGVVTITTNAREVPVGFADAGHNADGHCAACGGGTMTVSVCAVCTDAANSSHAADECPVCWSEDGAQRIRDRLNADEVEASGREDAETYLSELVDNETGNNRAPTLEDLDGLAPWDEGAINHMTTDARLELAGLPGDIDNKAAGRVWSLIQRDWCAAYNRGANARIEEERAEIEARTLRTVEEGHEILRANGAPSWVDVYEAGDVERLGCTTSEWEERMRTEDAEELAAWARSVANDEPGSR